MPHDSSRLRQQHGSAAVIALGLSITFGAIVLAFLFLYLPYLDRKEEEAQLAVLEARKAADAARMAAEQKVKIAQEQARWAEMRARDAERRAFEAQQSPRERRISEAHQQAVQSNQQRMELTARQQAQQSQRQQDLNAQRAAAEQRNIDELKIRCDSARKLPISSPNREAVVHQACTRYDDAVRRQHLGAVNR
jgi:hypothetical protein